MSQQQSPPIKGLITQALLLKCDLYELARDVQTPFVLKLAIKHLADRALALEEMLCEYTKDEKEETP
jgi:hypothetical protein